MNALRIHLFASYPGWPVPTTRPKRVTWPWSRGPSWPAAPGVALPPIRGRPSGATPPGAREPRLPFSRQRPRITAHVPGVQDIEIAVAVAEPAHVCGPLTVILSSLVTVPVKPLNGAPKESAQPLCVTTAFCPRSDASQCAVIFHVPATSGHVAPLAPAAGDALEPHASNRERTARNERRLRGAARRLLGSTIRAYKNSAGGNGAPRSAGDEPSWRSDRRSSRRLGRLRPSNDSRNARPDGRGVRRCRRDASRLVAGDPRAPL